MTETTAINMKISVENKARLNRFQDWLNYTQDGRWSQRRAMNEILEHSGNWLEFLNKECRKARAEE